MIPNPEYGGDVYAYDFAAIGFELWVCIYRARDIEARARVRRNCSPYFSSRGRPPAHTVGCLSLSFGLQQTVNNGTIFDNILVTDDLGAYTLAAN